MSRTADRNERDGAAHFRRMVAAAPAGICRLDARGRIVYANRRLAVLLGCPPGKLAGRRLLDFLDPAARRAAGRLPRPRAAGPQELRFRGRNGRAVWALATVRPVGDRAGHRAGAYWFLTDITARRRDEAQLRARAEQQRALFEQAADALVLFDPRTLAVLDFNDEACRRLGYTRAEFARLQIADFELLESAAQIRRHARRVVQDGAAVFETRHRTKAGAVLDIEIRSKSIRVGDRVLIQGIWRDITARKRGEAALRLSEERYRQLTATLEQRVAERTAALRESEERFRQMADNVQEVFWLADAGLRRVIYVSTAYEAIWGRSCRELYADPRAWAESVHPEDRARVQAAFYPARGGVPRLQAEYRIVRPDGGIRWIADRGSLIRDQAGRIYRIAGVARDITERRRLEEEVQQVSEMERQRFGHDLHDGLSQHLAAMSMLGDALARKLDGRRLPEAAETGKLAAYAREALELTRDLARALCPIGLQLSGLAAALTELAALIRRMFPIQCEVRGGDEQRLADANQERQLYRIAQEAVFNAAKHSRGRHIWIELQPKPRELVLTVSDDGIGLGGVQRSSHNLGLNVMRYRADLIGAALSFGAHPGGGTAVTCRLRTA